MSSIFADNAVREMPAPAPKQAFSQAFSNIMYLKVGTAIRTGELVVKHKALEALNDMYHKPENVIISLQYNQMEDLLFAFNDVDPLVRELASLAVTKVALSDVGRRLILERGYLSPICAMLNDAEVPVRLNAYTILINLGQLDVGMKAILEAQTLNTFVEKAKSDAAKEVQALALEALGCCLKVELGLQQALESQNAVTVITSLLTHPHPPVRVNACKCITTIGMVVIGRSLAINAGAVPLLIKLLQDADADVIAAAASALMFLAITLDAKNQCVEFDAPSALVKCLSMSDPRILLNATQAVSVVTEQPKARKAFLSNGCRELLMKMIDADSSSSSAPAPAAAAPAGPASSPLPFPAIATNCTSSSSSFTSDLARVAVRALKGIEWTP